MTIIIEVFYWSVAYTIYKVITYFTNHTNNDASYMKLYSTTNNNMNNNINNNIIIKKTCKRKNLRKIIPEILDTASESNS